MSALRSAIRVFDEQGLEELAASRRRLHTEIWTRRTSSQSSYPQPRFWNLKKCKFRQFVGRFGARRQDVVFSSGGKMARFWHDSWRSLEMEPDIGEARQCVAHKTFRRR